MSKDEKTLVVNGFKMVVGSVSPLAPKAIELQYKKKNPEPIQPSYSVEGAGVVTNFKHTPETVETKEEKEELASWQEEHDTWTSGLTFKLLRLFLSQGITLKLTAKQKRDIEGQLYVLEIDIPETEIERDLFYLETFVIKDEASMQQVIEAVLGATGIDAEALATADATFPD